MYIIIPHFSVIEAILFVRENHIGCFKDQPHDLDLDHEIPIHSFYKNLTIELCTKECSSLYYR